MDTEDLFELLGVVYYDEADDSLTNVPSNIVLGED